MIIQLDLGLQGMRERVAAAGGVLQLETEPGAGRRITVEISLRHNSRQQLGSLSSTQFLLNDSSAAT